MHCTLLIPDLWWRPGIDAGAARDLQLPALDLLLARGRCTRDAPLGMEAWLCSAFEVERQSDWPVAPLTLPVDGGDAGDAYWLRCDPVHLRAERTQLRLAEASAFSPTADEARVLVATLNAHFSADALTFHAPCPARWYLTLPRAPDLHTHALPDVVGKDINRFLPAGGERLRWHRLLNEVQMVLHEHPVNQARETAGQPTLNSVWLWGGGIKPAVRGRHFTTVLSDDALAAGLAAAADVAHAALPSRAPAFSAAEASRLLAVVPHLRAPASYGEPDGWRGALLALERDWFAPLLAALRARRLSGLALVTLGNDECRRYDVARADLWRFWRAPRPFGSHV